MDGFDNKVAEFLKKQIEGQQIGYDDAETMLKLLKEYKNILLYKAIAKRIADTPELAKQIENAQKKLAAYQRVLMAKLSRLEKETRPEEFKFYPDPNLLPALNEANREKLEKEHREREDEKSRRRSRFEYIRESVNEQIQDLEKMGASIKNLSEFINHLLSKSTKEDIKDITDHLLSTMIWSDSDKIPQVAEGPLFEETDAPDSKYVLNFERILKYFQAVSDIQATQEASRYLKLKKEIEKDDEKIVSLEEEKDKASQIIQTLYPQGFDYAISKAKEIKELEKQLKVLESKKPSNFIQKIGYSFSKEKKESEELTDKLAKLKEELGGCDLEAFITTINCRNYFHDKASSPYRSWSIHNITYMKENIDEISKEEQLLNNGESSKVERFLDLCGTYCNVHEVNIDDIIERKKKLEETITKLKTERESRQHNIEENPLSEAAQGVIDALGNEEARRPIIFSEEVRNETSVLAAFLCLGVIAGMETNNLGVQEWVAGNFEKFEKMVKRNLENQGKLALNRSGKEVENMAGKFKSVIEEIDSI